MTARLVVAALAVVAAASAAVMWGCSARCERDCAAAERQAQRLFERGELVAALSVIDDVDARCRCERFTSGDAPPEYALAQACLDRLHGAGQRAQADAFLARAKGPILRELAKAWAQGPGRAR